MIHYNIIADVYCTHRNNKRRLSGLLYLHGNGPSWRNGSLKSKRLLLGFNRNVFRLIVHLFLRVIICIQCCVYIMCCSGIEKGGMFLFVLLQFQVL